MFGTGFDLSFVFVFILVMAALCFTGVRFIKCAWCGRLTAQRDRSRFRDSAGACPECADRIRHWKRGG